MRSMLLIGRSVLTEAVRRREIYAIVAISLLLIGALGTARFFDLPGLGKFFREVALKVMTIATNLTVIVLAARQLPREFENRTIYPLLAKPVSRLGFMTGKLVGVMAAGIFCLGLFMAVFVAGSWYMGAQVHYGLFLQFLYLQFISLWVMATLSFLLSLLGNLDAAITTASLFYVMGNILTNALSYFYTQVGQFGRLILLLFLFAVPQTTLFDMSEKVVHQEAWPMLSWVVLAKLTAYGGVFAGVFFGWAYLLFRRRPL